MSRPLALTAVVLLFAPAARAAKTEAPPLRASSIAAAEDPSLRASSVVEDEKSPIPWGAPAHKLFFNYQGYLVAQKLYGETPASWAPLKAAEQRQKVKEVDEFLKAKLAKLLASDYLHDEDKALVKAVWGDEALAGVVRAAAAQRAGDPAQIKQAVEQTSKLVQRIGGAGIDWTGVFDGGMSGVVGSEPSLTKDFLKPETKPGFLDSLSSPETRRILATQRSYGEFLEKHGVSPQALPGMLAMYQVLNGATGEEKAQTAHLLPTVVTFLKDDKKVVFDPQAGKDAYGFAVPGDYDHPEEVKITPLVAGADPALVGKTLAHEFQHIYDMYTGRYYTLDSEMRGFKVAAVYFRALKKEAPDKYKSLAASDNDATRNLVADVESYSKDLDESPQKFREAVAMRYQNRDQGVFEGRMSLRETVDPRLESGAVVDLAMYRSRLETERKNVTDLEARQADVQRRLAAAPDSRGLDKDLEKTARDLAAARRMRDAIDQQVTIKQIRLKRMQSEVRWMDKAAAAAGREPAPYDLSLPVDAAYVTP